MHEKCQANEYIPTAEQEQIQISETNIKLTTNKIGSAYAYLLEASNQQGGPTEECSKFSSVVTHSDLQKVIEFLPASVSLFMRDLTPTSSQER